VKRVIQGLDANINWDSQKDTLKNEVLTKFRHELDDTLKESINSYKTTMKPLADLTESVSQVKSRLGMQNKVSDAGVNSLQGTDNSRSGVGTLIKQGLKDSVRSGDGSNLRGALDDISPEIGKEIKATSLREILEADTARGSRATVAGGALGALGLFADVATGGLTTAAGIAGGYARDKFGRKVGAELIQTIAHGGLGRVLNATGDGAVKYSKILIDAAAKGNYALMATHQLLLKKDEKYRNLFKDSE
jgi:hypothetical protein